MRRNLFLHFNVSFELTAIIEYVKGHNVLSKPIKIRLIIKIYGISHPTTAANQVNTDDNSCDAADTQ